MTTMSQDPLIGKTLRNRYKVLQNLGSGGFGKTYVAEDIEKFNEVCVIKQFAPQIQEEEIGALIKATELFEQEAKRLQQLGEHPQIPTLFAYFREDDCLYLVQQFINGQNLLEELEQQGTYSEQKIREFLLELLEIFKTVHQYNVIHRDIKPQNIVRRRSDGKLVLIDFGASKQLSQTVMTQQGTMIGSFGYAPQEQMQDGKAYPTNDLYSLGVTCFHLLTGIRPSELWQQQGYGWVTGWRQYLKQPVSQELGAILDKLLQPDYLQRYQSAEEALQALTNLNQKNQQKTIITKKKPKTIINPKLIGISVTLLLAVVIGVVIFTRTLDIRLPKDQQQKKEIPAF